MEKLRNFLTFIFICCLAVPVAAQQTKSIQLEHITDETFDSESVRDVNWMSDGRYYTALDSTEKDLELRKYDIVTGSHEVLLRSSELKAEGRSRPINIREYQFSDDESKLLIKTDVEEIWRRSTRANYFVYDLDTGALRKLTRSDSKQQYATLSPAGGKAAFVIDNNLYWVNLESGEQTQITTDGEAGKIINGAADWVYEEEFAFAKAWFWSPDGTKIAFYRFDESHVKEFFMTEWGPLYPDQVRFKHPKAGERNALVTIGVYNLETGQTSWMDVGGKKDQYIPRINWTQNSNTLAIRRMNRLQNRQDLMLADVTTGETEIIKTETSGTWIDVNDDLTFLDNGNQFIYVSEESGYNHVYLYDMSGKLINQVTSGEWEVTDFLGYDEESNRVYYAGTEKSPLERHLYSINMDGTGKRRMSDGEGWNEVDMSDDFKYYIETFSGPAVPPIYTLHRSDGEQVRVLEDNADLAQKLGEYNFPQKEFFRIDLPQTELNAYML
ncbi:MAG: DPP IV N-terminal domain-containing protein, partial [Balneolaceae bacterium]|nr:DPP IV N-terminal domain-containing protein [Balneolaceae bacterium]